MRTPNRSFHHGNYHSLEQFFRTIKRVAKLDATLNMPCLTIGSLFPFVAPAVAMDCAMVTNVGTCKNTRSYVIPTNKSWWFVLLAFASPSSMLVPVTPVDRQC